MSRAEPKSDYRLAIGYGSAWHLLRCLGWRRDAFNRQVAETVGATGIRWLDFPGYEGKQVYPSRMPIRDGEWRRLDFVADKGIQQAYDKFWPTRGEQQNWDAVGTATIDGKDEWLLVEAKAHSAEIHSQGTTASEKGGRPMIREAFRQTLLALGHDETNAELWAERWLTGYYQHANRLATLHFLSKHGVSAHLLFVYFCGDRHPDGKACPAKASEWKSTLDGIHTGLGLRGTSQIERRVHSVFVNVDRSENP
jgi:hypothetical protein